MWTKKRRTGLLADRWLHRAASPLPGLKWIWWAPPSPLISCSTSAHDGFLIFLASSPLRALSCVKARSSIPCRVDYKCMLSLSLCVCAQSDFSNTLPCLRKCHKTSHCSRTRTLMQQAPLIFRFDFQSYTLSWPWVVYLPLVWYLLICL